MHHALPRQRQRRVDAGEHPFAADQLEHLEDARAFGAAGDGHARRVDRARRPSAPRAVARPRSAGSSAAAVNGSAVRAQLADRGQMPARVLGVERCFATASPSYSTASARNGRPLSMKSVRRLARGRSRSINLTSQARPSPAANASRHSPASRSSGSSRPASASPSMRAMCCALNHSSFSGLKTALLAAMPSSENACDELVAREQLLVVARRPAEQREEVHHRFGQVALLRVLHHRRRAVALAQPALVRAEDERHVRERGHRRSRTRDRAAPASACSRCDRRRAPRA